MRNRSLISNRNSCSHDSDPPSRMGAAWRPQRFPPSKNPARTLVDVVRRSVCFISGRDSSTPENLQVSSTTLPCLNQTGAGWCLTPGRARCKNGLPSWPDKTLVRALLGGGAPKCLICPKQRFGSVTVFGFVTVSSLPPRRAFKRAYRRQRALCL